MSFFNAEKEKKKEKQNTVAQQVFPGYIAAEWWAQIKASLSWQTLEDFTLTVSLCQSNSAGAHQVNACQLKGALQKQDVLSARNALQKGNAQQELSHCLRSSQQVLWHLQSFKKAETCSTAAREMCDCRFFISAVLTANSLKANHLPSM